MNCEKREGGSHQSSSMPYGGKHCSLGPADAVEKHDFKAMFYTRRSTLLGRNLLLSWSAVTLLRCFLTSHFTGVDVWPETKCVIKYK